MGIVRKDFRLKADDLINTGLNKNGTEMQPQEHTTGDVR